MLIYREYVFLYTDISDHLPVLVIYHHQRTVGSPKYPKKDTEKHISFFIIKVIPGLNLLGFYNGFFIKNGVIHRYQTK